MVLEGGVVFYGCFFILGGSCKGSWVGKAGGVLQRQLLLEHVLGSEVPSLFKKWLLLEGCWGVLEAKGEKFPVSWGTRRKSPSTPFCEVLGLLRGCGVVFSARSDLRGERREGPLNPNTKPDTLNFPRPKCSKSEATYKSGLCKKGGNTLSTRIEAGTRCVMDNAVDDARTCAWLSARRASASGN